MEWFQRQGGQGHGQLSFTGLSDELAKQCAHVQILYADCIIADARANIESLSPSSIEASKKLQTPLLPMSDSAAASFCDNTSPMDCKSAAFNESGHGGSTLSSGGLDVICDACDIVLPNTALCYACKVCPDFHLCVPCHTKYEHCKEFHEFEVANTRAQVPMRPLCIADAYLRSALALPTLSNLLNDATLMKSRLCVADCFFFQRRYTECETICRDIVLVFLHGLNFVSYYDSSSFLFSEQFGSKGASSYVQDLDAPWDVFSRSIQMG
jgi:hypothetical protein